MDRSRRDILGAVSALVVTAGCLGGGDDPTSSPTAEPTRTATATPTPIETPTATPTEEPTPAPDGASIKLWPTSVTTVFDGDVSADTIHDELDDVPAPSTTYRRERKAGTVTFFVSASPSFYVSDAEEAFDEAADLSVRRVFKGVGPRYRRQYASTLGEQVAERTDAEADSVSVSPGRMGISQYLQVSAPTDQSALVPILPETELRRANGGTDERIVGPAGFDVGAGYILAGGSNGRIGLNVTLNEDGVEGFTDAVESASEAELRGAFFRPVVDDEEFRTFSLRDSFVTRVENGNWGGKLTLTFPARSAGEPTITRLTGFPPVTFHFEA